MQSLLSRYVELKSHVQRGNPTKSGCFARQTTFIIVYPSQEHSATLFTFWKSETKLTSSIAFMEERTLSGAL